MTRKRSPLHVGRTFAYVKDSIALLAGSENLAFFAKNQKDSLMMHSSHDKFGAPEANRLA